MKVNGSNELIPCYIRRKGAMSSLLVASVSCAEGSLLPWVPVVAVGCILCWVGSVWALCGTPDLSFLSDLVKPLLLFWWLSPCHVKAQLQLEERGMMLWVSRPVWLWSTATHACFSWMTVQTEASAKWKGGKGIDAIAVATVLHLPFPKQLKAVLLDFFRMTFLTKFLVSISQFLLASCAVSRENVDSLRRLPSLFFLVAWKTGL